MMSEHDLIHAGWEWWDCLLFSSGKSWGFISNPQPPWPIIRMSRICDPKRW